ncbi:protein adenylyltransferase SelO [Aestuariibacter salexigens]|uniref:protein adenylyltransferase SelO n=1 Tax=Aestuariibacter salexigens TaxID=226010 RepID=UPI0004279409|nr:YdiU family protein [Aestuariibacter salexigens]
MTHISDTPSTDSELRLGLSHSYAEQLPGFSVQSTVDHVAEPELAFFNHGLATELGLPVNALHDEQLATLFSGANLPADAQPIAQVYAGHQFGQFNPQLGDGRAVILGEINTPLGSKIDLCLKGSGRTTFSRGGDGKAALAPMLREVLIAEAMHALGIPTTRSLAVVSTGEIVYREQPQPGGILTRTASSHIRIGTFEYFAARGQTQQVKMLADYSIARHFPACANDDSPYASFLQAVIKRQAELIARWMGVGFIHGVMNTDNMSIAGETIDYGPCAFMDRFDPETVFSSIDLQGRYAYQNQPAIAQWNLARFAETLLPLLGEDEQQAIALATEHVNAFSMYYRHAWLPLIRAKLGLHDNTDDNAVLALYDSWLTLLETQQIDFTLAFRYLADAAEGNTEYVEGLFADKQALHDWLKTWRQAIDVDGAAGRMRAVNPQLIPRNHLVEEALEAASTSGDLRLFYALMEALSAPYEQREHDTRFLQPATPAFTDKFQTFCGT